MKGLFLFNKPVGVSSAGFLNKLKKYFPGEKIGHGGTLDPFAGGLLVVGVGREYTKKLHNVLKDSNKKYNAEIILGASSTTYDKTGRIEKVFLDNLLDEQKIKEAVERIKSKKKQTPPIFSAVKIKGERAYNLARNGKMFEIESKEVDLVDYKINRIINNTGVSGADVNSVDKKHFSIPQFDDRRTGESGESLKKVILIDIDLEVSSGFYVRSFAHDLGVEVGSDGYVKELTRTKIGFFDINEAIDINNRDVTDGGINREKEGMEWLDRIELYLRVSGKVQGVGYRNFALKNAQNWPLSGFVRNIDTDSVEMLAGGKIEDLYSFLKVVKMGPEGAKIDKVFDYFRKSSTYLEDFKIL